MEINEHIQMRNEFLRCVARMSGCIILLIAAVGAAALSAIPVAAQNPETLVNPNMADAHKFIADPFDMLSDATEMSINDLAAEVRKKTTCEVAVAIVKSLEGMTVSEYAYELFTHWGIGTKDKNNGVLLVVATDDRQAFIQVGSGAEGVLPDVACANIMRNFFRPAMKEGNLNQAVYNTVLEIANALTDPAVAEELRSKNPMSAAAQIKALDKDKFFDFLWILACCVFLFALGMFVIDLVSVHKRDNYRRAMIWRNHIATYWWAALLSCGLALPVAIIVWALYRHSRDVTEICDTCGAKMKKLSEDEDNAFLTASQDFEEKLGTVDYDVWLCPDCGTVERFPYREKKLKYHECQECHTIAENLLMDKVVVPPTTKQFGHGERIYQCQFCKHIRREGYRIPKKTDDAALLGAAVAGSILGSRGGHGGGGGFGGGFGGGSTSGGGAGTSW